MKPDPKTIENLKGYEANKAKSHLMNIVDQLMEAGAIREAKSLETIIKKLETWQHK